MTRNTPRISRRQALQILGGVGAAGLAGCTSATDRLPSVGGGSSGGGATPREPPTGPPDTTVELTASPGTVTPAPNAAATQWLYDGEFPAREIRASEGDVVSVTLQNQLPAETTIHWHGLPVANPMDGVPGVTQRPVGRGESFEYRFRAEPAGTYFFHSHAGLQLDRGLLGPLVVEEADPHVDFDREYGVVLDDYLPSEPRPASESSAGSGTTTGGPMGGGRMGGGPMGGMVNFYRPPYRGHLVNGRLAENPPSFDVSEGERVRFRFVNASSATMYQVGLGGHQFGISHADGRPVQPVTVDSFSFGPGERYDAIVTADNPGAWGLVARAVSGPEPPGFARFQYDGTDGQSPRLPSDDGRHLQYGDLRALEPLDGLGGSPDRTFNLTLAPGGDGYAWTIDGQVYPEADPLRVRAGEHVRVNMVNRSPVRHPMHLHGHFFQVGNAVKDTVVVPGHMGQVSFDFRADNPGDWLFHCHNLYHLEAGMARVLTYA